MSFRSKIIPGLERPEPIPRGDGEREKIIRDFDGNGFNPREVSAHGSRNSDKEPHSSGDIEAWLTVNKNFFSALRLTTAGAARNILLKFKKQLPRKC